MKLIREEQELNNEGQMMKHYHKYMVNEERKGYMTNQNWYSKGSKDIVSVTDMMEEKDDVEKDGGSKSH